MFNENTASFPEDNLNVTLDVIIHEITSSIGCSAFKSKATKELSGDYSSKSIWEELKALVHKPWVREACLISSVLVLKTGLWLTFRKAQKEGIEIVNL